MTSTPLILEDACEDLNMASRELSPAVSGAVQGEAEPTAAWRPTEGKRQRDPAGFVKLVQDNPGFWAWDFAVKYLTLTIDTRDPAVFWLADRDNNAIHPQRVLDAIERQRLGRLPARERAEAGQS